MAKTEYMTIEAWEEYTEGWTKEDYSNWLIEICGIDPTKISYTICQHTYDLFTMCKEWEEPKEYGDGQFSQVESYVFRHPILPDRDIHFAFHINGEMIDCYSVLPKS
jgi:hypothetical protein